MNLPPAAPPPPMSGYPPAPMAAPPPPPPKKSSALKWILIGCGTFAFLGILSCGGCFLVGYLVIKSAINQAVAKVKPIIASNETVKSEIGELRNVTPRFDFRSEKRHGRETIYCTLDVEGDKGKGTVEVKLYDHDKRKNEAYVTLVFINEAGNKRTPIGTWRLYDDGKGNAGFTPVDKPPPDDPPHGSED
ncbi:MAG TPA: hypothetical protein VK661_08495 [Planctomycetota bacterium]|nr:hypothetical protein [Planctomycetota bacterium]